MAKQEQADQERAEADMRAAEQTGQGAGARGAVRGAAAGALIGEIANDDAGKGAATALFGVAGWPIRHSKTRRKEPQRKRNNDKN